MKKIIKKIASVVICAMLIATTVVTTLPVTAKAAGTVSYTGSSSYMSGIYYKQLTSVTLTGNKRDDLINIARSQVSFDAYHHIKDGVYVGYRESDSASEQSGQNSSGSQNYTEYGDWFGINGEVNHAYWCAMFIAWCADIAGISSTNIAHSAGAANITSSASGNSSSGTEHAASTLGVSYTPQPGDLVLFKHGNQNHVGIIEQWNSSSDWYTLEGNTVDATPKSDGTWTVPTTATGNGYYACEKHYTSLSNVIRVLDTGLPKATVSNHGTRGAVEPAGDGYSSVTPPGNSGNGGGSGSGGNNNAASTLKVNVTNLKGQSITEGSHYNIAGTISSNYAISKATAQFYNASGATVGDAVTISPGTTSVNIGQSNLNLKLNFSTLKAGSYTLRVTATDSKKSVHEDYAFTVTSSGNGGGSGSGGTTTPSTLAISASAPTSVTYGNGANITGTISSNYKITNVYGYIYQTSEQNIKDSASCTPNATTLDIKSSVINQNLNFGKLAAGSYTLWIKAKDSSGAEKSWKQNFTVKTVASTLAISASAPTSVTYGHGANITGTISSNYKITNVYGYIYQTSEQNIKDSTSCTPNATTLDIKSSVINQNLNFGKLAAGSYTLWIKAKDASGTVKSWKQNFTVKNVTSTLTISASAPTSVTYGHGANITGTISSNYKITNVYGYIYQTSEQNIKDSTSCTPNATSVDIKSSSINQNLNFGKLAAGSYTLWIKAVDASGNSKSWKQNFTVSKATSTLSISITSAPSTVSYGHGANIAGTVKSNYKITSVVGYIYKGTNCTSQYQKDSAVCYPNATSLDIKTSVINKNLNFGKLAKGTYTLKIVATDASGKSVPYTKVFTVK